MRLIKLAAKLVDDFSKELHALRTPRTLQEMASALRYVPISKDAPKTSRAIQPNFLVSTPSDDPGHAKFNDLWNQERTCVAGLEDRELTADFKVLANVVARGLRARVSEAELCRLEFHGCLVSPAFVREIAQKIGIDNYEFSAS